MQFGVAVHFEKGDQTGRYIRGWASVVSVNGKPVVDAEGDVVAIDELRKAAHRFILEARVAKAQHDGADVGDVVESLIVDDDVAKALGITSPNRGWFVGMLIHEDEVAKRVKSGELRALSIGGRGKRRAIAG